MSIVYVVTEPLRRDRDTGELVKVFDPSQAKDFGEVRVLLSSDVKPWVNTGGIAQQLHAGLKTYTAEDYLLLIGNPSLIGMAAAIAASYSGGVLSLLQWNGYRQCYTKVTADLRLTTN